MEGSGSGSLGDCHEEPTEPPLCDPRLTTPKSVARKCWRPLNLMNFRTGPAFCPGQASLEQCLGEALCHCSL
ncbi:hypothetical protein MTO96_005792 [Rhipicephalus appendiculatus]